MRITPGKGVEVRSFNYAAGWSLGPNKAGDINVEKLRITNNRGERDGAFVEIKLWRGTEVVAATECTTDQIDPRGDRDRLLPEGRADAEERRQGHHQRRLLRPVASRVDPGAGRAECQVPRSRV
jgi:hypothetical protein